MTYIEILLALASGKIVHWKNDGYNVVCLNNVVTIGWNIGGKTENYVGLTEQVFNSIYSQDDFYICGERVG